MVAESSKLYYYSLPKKKKKMVGIQIGNMLKTFRINILQLLSGYTR